MFNVNFYSFSKKNNSTKIPYNDVSSFICDIRNISNILNPQIELKHENPTEFNYCYIPIFSRYYFISNWTWNQGLWIASCSIDVLATYKTEIGNETKNVVRSASNKNGKLIDNQSPLTTDFTTNYVHNLPYPNQTGEGIPSLSKGVYVIGVLGNNSGGQTMYEILPNQFQALLSSLLTTADGYDWGDLTRGMINSLMNPFQYITSCRWYPNEFVISGTEEIKCGLWGSGVNGYKIVNITTTPYASFFIPISKHPQSNLIGDYLNLSPFTKTILDASVFGLIELDSTMLIGANYIGCEIYVDAFSGIGTIKGYAESTQLFTHKKLLFKKDIQFGVGIPLSSNSKDALSEVVTTTLAIGSGIVTGDVGSIASGLLNIGNVASAMNGVIDSTGASGAITQHLNGFNLHQTFRQQADIDYINKGYPCMRNLQINTLNGFVVCSNGDVDLNCTDAEKEKIKQYLTGGFYYE